MIKSLDDRENNSKSRQVSAIFTGSANRVSSSIVSIRADTSSDPRPKRSHRIIPWTCIVRPEIAGEFLDPPADDAAERFLRLIEGQRRSISDATAQ